MRRGLQLQREKALDPHAQRLMLEETLQQLLKRREQQQQQQKFIENNGNLGTPEVSPSPTLATCIISAIRR